jgi:hypothetical protein
VIEKVGGFDPRYKICEDYDLWIRVAELYPIEYIHEILYYYSILQGSNSLTQRADIQKDHLSNIQQIVAESKKRVENLDRSNKK